MKDIDKIIAHLLFKEGLLDCMVIHSSMELITPMNNIVIQRW